jgi:tetratricopeptide (TPR) repeat protein
VNSLRVRLSGGASAKLAKHGTVSVEAHDLYLRGRFLTERYTRADLEHGLDMYRKALSLDPNYALAYTGIADSYVNLADTWLAPNDAYPKAKKAAEKAIALDHASAPAHSALGSILAVYEWQGTAAERELRRAIELDSNYARAHDYLGRVLSIRRQYDEAIEELRRAIALDPLTPRSPTVLSDILLSADRPDEALAAANAALEIDPHFWRAENAIGDVLLWKRDFAGARSAFERAVLAGDPESRALVAVASAALGQTERAYAVAAGLGKERQKAYVSAMGIAQIYAQLGNRNRAFQWLDTAFADRSAALSIADRRHRWDGIRSDPRWTALMKRIDWH